MKSIFFTLLFFIAFLGATKAQNYSRLSVTPIYLKYQSGPISFSNIADSVTIPDKYDYNFFGTNILGVPFPMVSPEQEKANLLEKQLLDEIASKNKNSDEIKRISKELKQAQIDAKKEDSIRTPQILQAITDSKIANKILASILIDPKLGYMTTDIIAKRAEYNASDADYIKAMNSETKMAAIRDKGIDLLKNVYIIIFDSKSLTNTPVNKEDSRLLNKSVSAEAYLIQIDIESLMNSGQFDPLIFTEPNQAKLNAFNQFTFPIKLILKKSISSSSENYTIETPNLKLSDLKNISQNAGANFIMKDENVLLKDIANGLIESADFTFTKFYDPFKVKISVFTGKPITAKIGKKESLKVDNLFKVTENVQSKNGTKYERKIGWVRAKTVVDNKKNADGKTEPSVFYKVGSRSVDKGMKLTETPELGIVLGVSYNAAKGNVFGGPMIQADYISHIKPGLRFGLGIGFGQDVETTIANYYKAKGDNFIGEFTIQKILQANRIEFTPYTGAYYSSITYKTFNNSSIPSALTGLQSTTYGALAGVKLGYDLGKHAQINVGYKVGFQIGFSTKDNKTPSYTDPVTLNSPAAFSVGLRLFGL